ncbi:MAG: TolC family protein [Bacteroidota bacterium]
MAAPHRSSFGDPLRVWSVQVYVGLLVVALAGGLWWPAPVCAQEAPRPVRIGLVLDEPNVRSERFEALVKQELQALVGRTVEVQFPEALRRVSDGTIEGVAADVEAVLANEAVDMLITLDFLGSSYAAQRAPWPTPVIAAFILDYELQDIPFAQGASGVPNLSYLTFPPQVIRDLETFQSIVPFETVEFLVIEDAFSVFPELVDRMQADAARVGVRLRAHPVGSTAAAALDRLPADAEAVYVAPMNHMAPGELGRLAEGLLARGLPSFTIAGAPDVEAGLMASLNAESLPRLARRVALHAHRIMLGDAPSELPVQFDAGEELVFNMAVIRELGIAPPLGLILEARRLNEVPEVSGPQLTLQSSMEGGIAANLTLTAERQALAARAQDVRLARSALLPAVTSSLTGVLVDESVAENSFGMQAQRSLDGALTVQQVLFSEGARAGVSIQRSLLDAETATLETLRLDIALEAAEAYLNVLRAQTLEQVQQDNLELTRTSLRLAEVRERIGAAGPGERLRLQSELSQRRADRVSAYAQRRAAEIALNQVLNRPLADEFVTAPLEAGGQTLIDQSLLAGELQSLGKFLVLGDFLTQEAFGRAPELQALEAAIQAQERLLVSRRRAFFLPTIGLQGEVSTNLATGGAGAEPLALPPELTGGLSTSEVTDFPWSLGLSASLPLFEGTARDARRQQALAELADLQFQRDLAAQRIEQAVRTRLQFAQASLATITEQEAAAEAALRSLDLVTDAYGQGVAEVFDLLEAQNRRLLAELGVANAIYDFLIDLSALERAIGGFEVLASPDDKAAFRERLERFYQEAAPPRLR